MTLYIIVVAFSVYGADARVFAPGPLTAYEDLDDCQRAIPLVRAKTLNYPIKPDSISCRAIKVK